MLGMVRKFARSWVAKILMGLLVVSFAVWGINDVFKSNNKDNLATVNGKDITIAEYKTEFDRFIKRASEETKQTVTTQQVRDAKEDIAILEQMVSEKAFGALMQLIGVYVSDTKLKTEIAKIPAFIDPTTGKFSEIAYQQTLSQNKLTVAQFETSVRNDMARQLMTVASVSGFRAPKYYSSQTLAYSTERRTVSMLPVTPAMVGGAPTPTDQDLQNFYNQNKERLMRPETRDVTVVVAQLTDFLPKVKVDEAEVQKIFNIQKDKLVVPAKRSFVQIVAPDEAKANQAAAMLKAGKNPVEISKALGLQNPLTFNDSTLSQIPDKEVGKAVFAAQVGVASAVKGALSYSAFVVTSEQVEKAADFAAASVKIREELAKEQAGQELTNATETYEQAVSQGDSVEVAAGKAGFKITKLVGITQQGQELATGKVPDLISNIMSGFDDVFNIAKGDTTDLLTSKNDSYVAFRVDNIKPKAPVPLAEVKTELAQAWVREELGKRVKAKAEEILKVAQASSLEAAAKKYNLTIVKPPQPLLRGQGSKELSAAIFDAKKGTITFGPVADGVQYAVVRVDNIQRDDENKAPDRLAQAEQSVRGSVQEDIMTIWGNIARERTKTKTYPERLNRVFGDDNAK